MSPLLNGFASHARAGRIAVTDERGPHSYAEIWARAHDVARTLRGDKASLQGERIAMLIEPGAEFVATLYGIWLARGCAIVLSQHHPSAESEYVCADSGARTVLVSRAWRDKLGEVERDRTVVELEDIARSDSLDHVGKPGAAVTDDALQLYTSGTTGKPKGAVLTHYNLAMQQALVGEAWRFAADDTLLHVLPLHHMHGLAIALFTALGAGAQVHMLPAFDATRVWEEMGTVSVFMAVPTMYSRLFVAFDAADEETRKRWASHAHGLRLATSGSAALPIPLATRWEAIAGQIPLERFGMTEIGVGLSNLYEGPRKKGSVGYPLPTVQTRVVDDNGKDALVGELWIRGPSVFRGYHRREDANKEAFVKAGDAGPPWFKTGDTVSRDTEGAFRILGRTSVDILKSGGYKLSALEIENVISEMPQVAEVAVVGLPDEQWGERVVACIVPNAGQEAACTDEAIRTWVRTKLAPYKCPKEVRLMTSLPRNAMGKVVKPDLVKSLSQGLQKA